MCCIFSRLGEFTVVGKMTVNEVSLDKITCCMQVWLCLDVMAWYFDFADELSIAEVSLDVMTSQSTVILSTVGIHKSEFEFAYAWMLGLLWYGRIGFRLQTKWL